VIAALSLLLLAAQAPAASPAAAPAAAVPAPASAGTTLRQDDLRVGTVAYRLAVAGRAVCPRTIPQTGLLFHHLGEYLPRDRPWMVAQYGLDRGPGVLAVVAGSPADQAGLVAGDVLLSVDGAAFPSPLAIAAERDPKKMRALTEASEAQLEDALSRGPAELGVLREGRALKLSLGSVPGCEARVRLARSSQVNAFHTGRKVVMTTAMLAFVANDDELAVVLGHEMSHPILHHPVMSEGEGILAGFGIGAGAIWQREAQADRFGLRLMAAAGYDLGAVIPFWRRYLTKYDGPQLFRSHPSLEARAKMAAQEIAAIRAGEAWKP
jgi:membrane-associated protease RseP (regulator of RpoE activity)